MEVWEASLAHAWEVNSRCYLDCSRLPNAVLCARIQSGLLHGTVVCLLGHFRQRLGLGSLVLTLAVLHAVSQDCVGRTFVCAYLVFPS